MSGQPRPVGDPRVPVSDSVSKDTMYSSWEIISGACVYCACVRACAHTLTHTVERLAWF